MSDTPQQQFNVPEWDMIVIPLKFTWQVTEDELIYLKRLVYHRMKHQELIPFNQQDNISPSIIIDDFLYHGDLKHAMNKTLLDAFGIRRIINVCDCPLEQEIVDQRHVLWINIDDDTYTDIAQYFNTTNEFLQSCKTKGEKVLVHCQMGVSRSSAIVLAYLMKYCYDSLEKAYDYLVERRRCAEPNLGFLLQLFRYERKLLKTYEINKRQKTDEEKKSIEISDTIEDLPATINLIDESTKMKTAKAKINKYSSSSSRRKFKWLTSLRKTSSSSRFPNSWSFFRNLCCCSSENTRPASSTESKRSTFPNEFCNLSIS